MLKNRKSWFPRNLPSSCGDERGLAAVEFALLAPMFIALVLVSVTVGVVLAAKSSLDYTTQVVARQIMTGQVSSQPALQTAICGNTVGFLTCANIMANLTSYTASKLENISTATPTLAYNSDGSVSNTWNTQFGNSGSIEVLQLMYPYPMLAGPLVNLQSQSNGSFLMISTVVFVNE